MNRTRKTVATKNTLDTLHAGFLKDLWVLAAIIVALIVMMGGQLTYWWMVWG